MKMSENSLTDPVAVLTDWPILLAVERREDDLLLRLDTDPFGQRSDARITLLEISGCVDVAQIESDLRLVIGHQFEYSPDAHGSTGLWMSLPGIHDFVECEQWSERGDDLTRDDLIARSRFLGEWLARVVVDQQKVEAQHHNLRAALEREIDRERDRGQRKLAFFQEHNEQALAVEQARMEAVESIARILKEHP